MTAKEQIAADIATVTKVRTVVGSAKTLIDGFVARLDAAVAAALANGATAEELHPLTDLSVALDDDATALAASVAANTPAATP